MVPSKSTYPIDITQIPKFNQDQLQMAEVLQIFFFEIVQRSLRNS